LPKGGQKAIVCALLAAVADVGYLDARAGALRRRSDIKNDCPREL
jgi:hypothetical protein